MDNAESHDDIDILIMTKPKTLWITRLFVTLFTEFVTTRRHPGEKEISDAICLNMFLTSYGLTVPEDERGWYTAHEVLQFVPLWEREHAYKKFLSANQWAEKWFSMAYAQKRQMRVHSVLSISRNISFYQFLDGFAHKIQLWYMRKRRTTEIVTASVIRFHPVDARRVIREVFTKAIKQLKIPLDKHLIRI